MKMQIKVTKENVVLYDKSVTADAIPADVLTLFMTVHDCCLIMSRD